MVRFRVMRTRLAADLMLGTNLHLPNMPNFTTLFKKMQQPWYSISRFGLK